MKKRYVFLPLLFILIVVLLIGCHNIFKGLSGGPVEGNIRKSMVKQLNSHVKKEGFSGKVTLGEASHFGFSRVGIDAEYIYTENINHKNVKITGDIEATDDGEIDFRDDVVINSLKQSSLQQPIFKKYKKKISDEFEKYAYGKMKFENVTEEVDTYDFSNDSKKWFEDKVAKNRNGETSEINGPVDELLRRNIVRFNINYGYDEGKENESTATAGHKILDKIIRKADISDLPDGQYSIGFEYKHNGGTSGSITDMKYFLIKNGKIVSTGKYGDEPFIEKDILILKNKKKAD